MLVKPTQVLLGVGIHSGLPARVQIKPLPPGRQGIFFQREGEELLLHASYNHVSNTKLLKTELGNKFQTVEHVMASLFGLNVFHAVVVVGGESGEVPIMDGGCMDFCHALRDAEIAPVVPLPPITRITKPQTVIGPGGAFCQLLPSTRENVLQIELSVEFTGCTERIQYVHDYGQVNPYFCNQVAPAKTFCMRPEVDKMQAMGLGLGGTRNNCVVYEDNHQPSPNLHRAKHKLLDLLGDFALCGHTRLVGKIIAHRSGHALNHQAVAALLTSQ
ncbi:hypothetical protein BASA81_012432 [Batrachochytrium salamandrivorans]|nr:hypothetical protein BASA81_012432 [Batrachochytrium salamandrivorans]